ncbi:MAG TPA: TraR/DksA C4-type zinc finger protein [Pseudolysinimonas sp.]|nr:TraR/DksA C4-type zinc finger protein [Pseudolysinimonas sp.]
MAASDWIQRRRLEVQERLAVVERRLAEVRIARGEWTDEEHDPEGFTLTFEWQEAEGTRNSYLAELSELHTADDRLATGRYGICEACGAAIPEAQLELRPARTVCVACAGRRRR